MEGPKEEDEKRRKKEESTKRGRQGRETRCTKGERKSKAQA